MNSATFEYFQRQIVVDELIREIGRNSMALREEQDFLTWITSRTMTAVGV